MTEQNLFIPDIIFIVPYRHRSSHKIFFTNQMQYVMNYDTNKHIKYSVYFSLQNDERPFNRGAMKNIGFLAMKRLYPNDYQNITFVFNDVDTVPSIPCLHYQTTNGNVKHFYGFNYALGGIVSITGHDFEQTNGFPNLWGWGMEDNIFQQRCLKNKLIIDRSTFYKIGDSHILQLFDGTNRLTTDNNLKHLKMNGSIDGLISLNEISHKIQKNSPFPEDNSYYPQLNNYKYINIKSFNTLNNHLQENYHQYNLRKSSKDFLHSKLNNQSKSFVSNKQLQQHIKNKTNWNHN